jgi:hypothetical protein
MNAWDVATWIAAFALGATALVIFGFFLRDARSILLREMHGQDEEPKRSSAPGSPQGESPPAAPDDPSR